MIQTDKQRGMRMSDVYLMAFAGSFCGALSAVLFALQLAAWLA